MLTRHIRHRGVFVFIERITMSRKQMTLPEVISLLKETLQVYRDNEELMYYRYYLNQQGFSSTKLCHWMNKGNADIKAIVADLEDLQESRLWNELIKKNSKVNVTGAIFSLKTHHKAIEYERWLHLELEKLKTTSIDKPQDFSININYSPIPSRSEDDINTLLEVK